MQDMAFNQQDQWLTVRLWNRFSLSPRHCPSSRNDSEYAEHGFHSIELHYFLWSNKSNINHCPLSHTDSDSMPSMPYVLCPCWTCLSFNRIGDSWYVGHWQFTQFACDSIMFYNMKVITWKHAQVFRHGLFSFFDSNAWAYTYDLEVLALIFETEQKLIIFLFMFCRADLPCRWVTCGPLV